MRIYREGTRVIIEIEENDAPEGFDLEMFADAVVTGVKFFITEGIKQKIEPEMEEIKERVKPELEETARDFMEKWELTRSDYPEGASR